MANYYSDKRISGILEELRKKARKKSQQCYAPNCTNTAIRSHVQQKEGAIRGIAENGHVIQLTTCSYQESCHYKFQKTGIGSFSDTLTFWGFCPRCDNEIFKSIESKQINFLKAKTHRLYAYRGLHSELYKIDYNLKHYELIFSESSLSSTVKKDFENLKIQQSLGKYTYEKVKHKLDNEIFPSFIRRLINPFCKSLFKFSCRSLPYVEICSTASFSYPKKIRLQIVDGEIIYPSIIPSACIFFNLIPNTNETILIFGIEKKKKDEEAERLFEKISTAAIKDLEIIISNILMLNIETWFISNSQFEKWKSKGMDRIILDHMNTYVKPKNVMVKTLQFELNIFT